MAVNLRLPDATAAGLRARSESTGVSQQEILRRALERYLATDDSDPARVRARLRPARRPYAEAERRLRLPEGLTSADLLDRDDRI